MSHHVNQSDTDQQRNITNNYYRPPPQQLTTTFYDVNFVGKCRKMSENVGKFCRKMSKNVVVNC